MRRWRVLGKLVIVGCLLTGCTGVTYINESVDARQHVQDGMQCRALAEQGTPPGGLFRGAVVEGKVKACLESLGYHPAPQAS